MATLYKLYVNKDRMSALVQEDGKTPDAGIWDSIGEVEGEDTFDLESASNVTLFHFVKDLLYKAFLSVGELGEDSEKHLYAMGLPSGFTIHTIDPSKQLVLVQGADTEEKVIVNADGGTIAEFAKFAELGNGTITLKGYGLPATPTLVSTDKVKVEVGAVDFEPQEYRNRDTNVTVTATDEDGRTASYSARVVVLHPSTPEYAGDAEITGTLAVGDTLTADVGTWTNTDTTDITTTVQWLRDGVAIEGATDLTYEIVTEDVDAMLSVRIRATAVAGETHEREVYAYSPEVGPATAV